MMEAWFHQLPASWFPIPRKAKTISFCDGRGSKEPQNYSEEGIKVLECEKVRNGQVFDSL